MGEVVELKRSVCTCGWELPKIDVALEDGDFARLKLAGIRKVEMVYDCPRCGNGFKHAVEDER